MGHFTKRQQIVILIFGAVIAITLGYKIFNSSQNMTLKSSDYPNDSIENVFIEENNEDRNNSKNEYERNQEKLKNQTIIVHVTGQVRNPELVTLKYGDRVIDAIDKLGGLTKEADENKINLARKVEDEEQIYIPKIGESEVEINSNTDQTITSNNGSSLGKKVNINTASKDELLTLPGVGEVLADRIIQYRNDNKFSSIEDIINVSGIGKKKYESIKELITIR